MKVRVFVLRRSGRRFHDRNQEGIVGELRLHATMHGEQMHRVARLCARTARSAREEQLLPPLYAPELVAVGSGGLLLRGFEANDGVGHVQEWRCILDAGTTPDA